MFDVKATGGSENSHGGELAQKGLVGLRKNGLIASKCEMKTKLRYSHPGPIILIICCTVSYGKLLFYNDNHSYYN